MQALTLTRFWHRRICEATMFISLMVVGLYFLPYVMTSGVASGLFISWTSLALSIATFVVALICYFWAPQKYIATLSFFVYTLLVATTANLIVSTGETSSPFIALWIAVAVFAGVFGLKGFLLLLLGTTGYLGYAYLQEATMESLIIAAIAGIAPLIASYIIWHTKSNKDNDRDKAYQELASELSHESSKSDVVINAINDGVVAVDKQGVIQLINPAAQRIIGWGQNDAIGLSYKSVVKLNDRADKPITVSNDPVEKVLAGNQEVHSEDFSITTDAGKKVLLSLIVSPIGRPSTGAILVFRDMTKEKAEEREQAEFISTASHEMRTPVASIEGYLGLVLNPSIAQIDDKTREYIVKAQASAQHLGRLFQDLLDVSKAEDGRMGNDPSVVDVIEFVDEIVEGLRPKAEEKGLRFLYKPRPDATSENSRSVAPVYYVNVDNDHLREVVANLVENAIKYTLTGDVIIDVTGDDRQITLSVQDSGIGIPTEDIPHLFQKFYRVDNSDTREIGGTGLGLYLCRRLTEVMGGQIRVESEYKRGSTFFLDLPRIDPEEASELMETAAANAEEQAAPLPKIVPDSHAAPLHSESENTDQAPAQPIIAAPITPPTVTVAAPAPEPSTITPVEQTEQNPAAYQNARPSIQIPVRDPSHTNQT